MSFWIVVGAISVAAVAALALPLFRSRVGEADPAEFDLEVYRDQIAELERDCERGVVTRAEMAAARTEIARRMLAADARLKAHAGQAFGGRQRTTGIMVLAVAVAVLVPLAAVLLYTEIGQPGTSDMPLAARADRATGGPDGGLGKMIAELEQAAQDNPDDADTWLNLGLAYKQMQRFGESAEAMRRAFALRPATPMLSSEFGEALVMAAQGTVTPEAQAAFKAALAGRPNDIRGRHYLALADYQAGRTQQALNGWADLIRISPADAPWLNVIREYMVQAAGDLGVDVAEVMPEPQSAAESGGLTAEQRAALDAMTPEEREATIRSMIDGLEVRLGENPMDLEGWEQLIRARHVMGEVDAAQAALDRALEVFVAAPFPRQRLISLAEEVGLNAPAGPGDVDISAMVQRLAERLKQEPDDLDGWLMLARSYTVMGERAKARDAMANAVRLAPEDPRVLALQAGAIRDANGGRHNAESMAILRRVLALDPDHAEALWFVGNAEAEAGNTAKAIEMLERAYQQIPEGGEDRAFIQRRIDELRGG